MTQDKNYNKFLDQPVGLYNKLEIILKLISSYPLTGDSEHRRGLSHEMK